MCGARSLMMLAALAQAVWAALGAAGNAQETCAADSGADQSSSILQRHQATLKKIQTAETDTPNTGLVCKDGLEVKPVHSSECPSDPHRLGACDDAKEGELCEGDGECGTDHFLNNCGPFDVYLKGSGQVETEVVIIGAGLAGMAAAKSLHEAGVSFMILEADSRLGGRCKSGTFAGMVIEKGANWIHGPWEREDASDHNIMWDLKMKYGIKGAWSNYTDFQMFTRKGERVNRALALKWGHQMDEMLVSCEDMAEKQWGRAEDKGLDPLEDADFSVRKCLKKRNYFDSAKTKLEKDVAKTWAWEAVTLSSSLRPRRASNMWFWPKNGDFVARDFFVTDEKGFCDVFMQSTAEAFHDSVHMDQFVQKVKYSRDNVEVTTKQGLHVKARLAISTLPLGVLQRGTVSFEPPFSQEKEAAIQGMTMGHYSKVFLRFPNNFWGDEEVLMITGDPVGWLTWAYNLDHPKLFPGSKVLNFHFADEIAKEIDTQSLQATQTQIMHSLREVFPNCSEPTDVYVSGWAKNPLSWGAYSAWPVGYTEDEHAKMSGNEGNLFFAGEHTNSGFFGFTHGAIWTGERAADEVLARLHSANDTLVFSAQSAKTKHRQFRFKSEPVVPSIQGGEILNNKAHQQSSFTEAA